MTWLDNGFGNCDNARVVLDPEAAMPEHVIYSGLINRFVVDMIEILIYLLVCIVVDL